MHMKKLPEAKERGHVNAFEGIISGFLTELVLDPVLTTQTGRERVNHRH